MFFNATFCYLTRDPGPHGADGRGLRPAAVATSPKITKSGEALYHNLCFSELGVIFFVCVRSVSFLGCMVLFGENPVGG